MSKSKIDYPECEKMQEVQEQSQSIGEFLEWLQSKKEIVLSKYCDDVECQFCEESEERLISIMLNTEKLLAEYFDIDLEKAEKEKQVMLKKLQNNNK